MKFCKILLFLMLILLKIILF
nr:unnamed protein product [Callosobruchus chinensis]